MIICEVMGGSNSKLPEYSYTGQSELRTDEAGNWVLKLLSDGELTIAKPNSAGTSDVFSVGGGANGGAGERSSNVTWGYGGNGGRGGRRKTQKGVRLKKGVYRVTIGANGSDSRIMDADGAILASSEGGTYSPGGGGSGRPEGRPSGASRAGENGKAGGPAFDEPGGELYGGSGGGGAYNGGQSWGGAGGGGKGTPDGGGLYGGRGENGKGGGGGGGTGGPEGSYGGGPGGTGALLIRNSKRRRVKQ